MKLKYKKVTTPASTCGVFPKPTHISAVFGDQAFTFSVLGPSLDLDLCDFWDVLDFQTGYNTIFATEKEALDFVKNKIKENISLLSKNESPHRV